MEGMQGCGGSYTPRRIGIANRSSRKEDGVNHELDTERKREFFFSISNCLLVVVTKMSTIELCYSQRVSLFT